MNPPKPRGEAALEQFRQVLCRAAETIGCTPISSTVDRDQATVDFATEWEADSFFSVCGLAGVGKMQGISDKSVFIVLRIEPQS